MGKVIFSLCVSVHTSTGGGYLIQPLTGGVPGLRFWGGSPVSDFWGGPRSQIFRGGTRSSHGGGVRGLRFSGGRSQVSDFWGPPRSQIFFGGGFLVSVKGKIFDTRFGLIHVQTGKKNFCQGTPPPPSKGEKF